MRASRHLGNAVRAVIRRQRDIHQLTHADLTEVASLESINAGQAIARTLCILANIDWNGEPIRDEAEGGAGKVDHKTLREIGALVKTMKQGMREARAAPERYKVEEEGAWTQRLLCALRADDALRIGLVEGAGPLEQLARHERADEIAPTAQRLTAARAPEIEALAQNLPRLLEDQVTTAITNWKTTYKRIAETVGD